MSPDPMGASDERPEGLQRVGKALATGGLSEVLRPPAPPSSPVEEGPRREQVELRGLRAHRDELLAEVDRLTKENAALRNARWVTGRAAGSGDAPSADPFAAVSEAERTDALTPLVTEALNAAWADWIADTGEWPYCIEFTGTARKPMLSADFRRSNFARHVAGWLAADPAALVAAVATAEGEVNDGR